MSLNATLLGQMLTFSIFVFFTMKVVWPVLEQALEERKKKISDGLQAAAEGYKKLTEADAESAQTILAAKKRSEDIINEANRLATRIVDEARETGRIEKEKLVASGYKSLEQAVGQAKIELQQRVANLVVSGAEKILGHSVDKNEHKDFLKTLSENF